MAVQPPAGLTRHGHDGNPRGDPTTQQVRRREPSAAAPTHLLRGGVAAWVPVVTVPGETRWGLDRHRRASSDAVISPRGAEAHKTPSLCNSFAMTLKALFGRFGGSSWRLGVVTRILFATATAHAAAHKLNSPYLPRQRRSPTGVEGGGTFPHSTAMQCVPGCALSLIHI